MASSLPLAAASNPKSLPTKPSSTLPPSPSSLPIPPPSPQLSPEPPPSPAQRSPPPPRPQPSPRPQPKKHPSPAPSPKPPSPRLPAPRRSPPIKRSPPRVSSPPPSPLRVAKTPSPASPFKIASPQRPQSPLVWAALKPPPPPSPHVPDAPLAPPATPSIQPYNSQPENALLRTTIRASFLSSYLLYCRARAPPTRIGDSYSAAAWWGAQQYDALETGDAVRLIGQQRVTAATAAAAVAQAAAGKGSGLTAAAADQDVDSDYIQADTLSVISSSFYRYLRHISYEVPRPRPFTSITYILNICGQVNPLKRQDLLPYWDGSAMDGATLPQFISDCSHGVESFSQENNVLLEPIDVPCYATPSNNRSYDSQRCTDREVFGWMQYAMDVVQQSKTSLGLQPWKYERRIFLIPDLPACGEWWSLASVGCSADCPLVQKVMPGSSVRTVVSQLIHDLGHSYSLSHGGAREGALPSGLGRAGGARADPTCPMGSASEAAGLVCPNAPNSYKNGWLTLLDGKTRSSTGNITGPFIGTIKLPPTNTRRDAVVAVTVPAAAPTGATGLRGGSPPNGRFFISYRLSGSSSTGSAYDKALAAELSGQVYVHQYDGMTARVGTPYKPLLVGASTDVDVYKRLRLGATASPYFAVRVVSTDANYATIQVCSAGTGLLPQQEPCKLCADGLDNDCNGLIDEQDLACQAC
ncbi:hypothetical protein VOLCADRAFT_89967 [Volvox carteri f. nagariensis]|uniref:Peptidase M11 gametolysin domain-containing protein n=1 Tax=Volvox carteri f. nagariensis TaxID=3068 RepID=D8TT49_VOLCA|nr:uncharacterized protein VOLCADRAFT_89967 [Volvox carteri f. nagariensis]EFJ49249.1 hypothetical protein VOLCADRAFT_89967 [Volvox carteri f. nagariensis]|eukprot:XP_002949697.1 hypothetical protein VOLCADRAFT_89967 [Volvox carteri f. nagariensis]